MVAADIRQAIASALAIADPWARIASYTRDHRDLLYREPAAVDAILMDYPDSPRFVQLCHTAADAADRFIRDGHRAGVVRADFTVDDFNHATVATALTMRHGTKPRPGRLRPAHRLLPRQPPPLAQPDTALSS